jgi:TatD DNase family protein
MFDTHTHLNFSRFKNNVEEVIQRAKDAGVELMVVPGTDIESSQKAVEIANSHQGIFAAVGIHPHHVFELKSKSITDELIKIEELLKNEKVVAVGEVGMDRHVYEQTKYESYAVDDVFIGLQKELLEKQISLAIKYKKSLILHNREARVDVLKILKDMWDPFLEGRSVFHCCEVDPIDVEAELSLLDFACSHKMFMGIDGDITYFAEKKEFIKKVPLEMLVLETDSPFLLPEPLRTQKKFPNEPSNLGIIAQTVADAKNISVDEVKRVTTENATKLFYL